jgi:biotin transport system substrate-specific component
VAGVPVFSGFRGGFSVLLGPTGGYLWGFLAAAMLYWALEKHLPSWLNMALGMALCYVCGTIWYYMMFAPGTIWPVVLTCVVPYLLPDGLKLFLAYSLGRRLKAIVR